MNRLTAVYLAWRSEVIKLAGAINAIVIAAWCDTKLPIRVVAKAESAKLTHGTKESSMGVNLARRYVWR